MNIDDIKMYSSGALSTFNTILYSYMIAEDAIKNNVAGDFVECGVFAGTQVAAMARAAMNHSQSNRKIHLFDSFEGIPKAGVKDDHTITDLIGKGDGELISTGVSVCSIEQVKSNMRSWRIDPSILVYHKGWFQNTVPDASKEIGSIAVLRLDGDLYESTKVCLEHLYSKVSKGGYVIIDDYALNGCKLAVNEFLESVGEKPNITAIIGGLGPVYFQKA